REFLSTAKKRNQAGSSYAGPQGCHPGQPEVASRGRKPVGSRRGYDRNWRRICGRGAVRSTAPQEPGASVRTCRTPGNGSFCNLRWSTNCQKIGCYPSFPFFATGEGLPEEIPINSEHTFATAIFLARI